MKIKAAKASGKSKCRGVNCKLQYHSIGKGQSCFAVLLPFSPTRIYYICSDCMIDMFIDFRKIVKESDIYNQIVMKDVLE